ncbi:MAG: tetratricopeptide repeat protein, partial [Candidatus Acidoferrales bacterium]
MHSPRPLLGSLLALVLALALALSLPAQQQRWEALITRAAELNRQEKYTEAIPIAEAAVRVAETTFGSNHPNVAISLNNLAELYREQGMYAEAEPLYLRAISIDEKALGLDHPSLAININNLALLYDAQG